MVRISKNNIILFTVILLSLGIYGAKNIHILTDVQQTNNQIVKNDAHSDISAYTQIRQEMDKQEQEAWNLLQKQTHISKSECLRKQKRIQNKNQELKYSDNRELKKETVKFVENIVSNFGLNPADIRIASWDGKGSPAAASDTIIFIDEEKFEQFSLEACKFFIAHEISHLRSQDDSMYKSIYAFVVQKKRYRKNKQMSEKDKKALEAFRRFHEIRADMNALLDGGEKYACGAFEFFHKLQEFNGGDNPGITHPKTSKRIEIAQDICAKMGWKVKNIA